MQYRSRYSSETYVNFEGNYLIFTPNLTQNVIILSRSCSGTSYPTSPVTVPKLMLSLKVIIWFLLLIWHKVSYHIFANHFWNQLPFKSCYCSETNINLEGNYLIFTPIFTQNVIIFSRSSSGTSYPTSPVTVPKLMLILKVIIWFLLLIWHKM